METRYSKYEPVFGSWYIRKSIGRGSAGEVFLIEREDLGITYRSALKCITVPQSEDEIRSIRSNGMTDLDIKDYYDSFMRRIRAELTNMAKLKGNSNIVSYEDHLIVQHEEGIGWDILIRMELLTPLLEFCEEHPLTEKDVVQLGHDLCKALELCEHNSIIHRDIKPENIFVSSSGDFKLGDFGISRTVEETRIGLSQKGTYTYMAPEVYKGEPYGPRSDIYSLGLVMYKYLNGGRNAFMPGPNESIVYEDSDRAFFKRMSGAEMPPPAMGSRQLQQIVLKACSYLPKDRYGNAEEMMADIDELIAGDEGRLADPGVGLETRKRRRKRSLKAKIAGIAAVILVAGGVTVYAMTPKVPTDITGISDSEELYIGDTYQYEYVVEPERFADEAISFESSDPAVVTVNDSGDLTGKSAGEAKLTLEADGFTKTVEVKVVPKVKDIRGIKSKVSLEVGDTYTFKPTLAPKKFADEKVSYSSSDKSVASVSRSGKVTAKNAGTAVIRISAGGRTEKVKVTVTEPEVDTGNYSDQGYSQYSGGNSGYSGGSSSNSSSNSSGSESSSGSSSGGYFDDGDDEYFQTP